MTEKAKAKTACEKLMDAARNQLKKDQDALKKAKEDAEKKQKGADPKKGEKSCAQPAKSDKDKKDDKDLDRKKLDHDLKNEEGKGPQDTADKKYAYDDSKGYRTIGHGTNLDSGGKPGSGAGRDMFNSMMKGENFAGDPNTPLDFDSVYNGDQYLTEAQATKLFTPKVDSAIGHAKQFLTNYDDQPAAVKGVVSDMIYNMNWGHPDIFNSKGKLLQKATGMQQFKNFRKALNEGRYEDAAHDLLCNGGKASQYYNDTKSRAIKLASQLLGEQQKKDAAAEAAKKPT